MHCCPTSLVTLTADISLSIGYASKWLVCAEDWPYTNRFRPNSSGHARWLAITVGPIWTPQTAHIRGTARPPTSRRLMRLNLPMLTLRRSPQTAATPAQDRMAAMRAHATCAVPQCTYSARQASGKTFAPSRGSLADAAG